MGPVKGGQSLTEQLRAALHPPGLAELVERGIRFEAATVARTATAMMAWWYPEPGRCEVIAATGSIAHDADWLLEALGADMRRRGATELAWTGDRPWELVARRLYDRRRH